MRLVLLLASTVLAFPSLAVADEPLWALMRGGGQIILMRHAVTTPGVGDPVGFRLEDCSTQRNLTDAGREDARRVGVTFRARGIPVGRVLSSSWCRCHETARLAFGAAEAWGSGNLLLVTHGSVVLPLTGIQPAPAELVVLTPDGAGRFRVAGRLTP